MLLWCCTVLRGAVWRYVALHYAVRGAHHTCLGGVLDGVLGLAALTRDTADSTAEMLPL
jgi:hypothetical protein